MERLEHVSLVAGLLQLDVEPHVATRHRDQLGQQRKRWRVARQRVVLQHETAIGRAAQIRLDRIRAEIDRRLKRFDRVVGKVGAGPAVSTDDRHRSPSSAVARA